MIRCVLFPRIACIGIALTLTTMLAPMPVAATIIDGSSGGAYARGTVSGVDSWLIHTPNEADIVVWKSGTNIADGVPFAHPTISEEKFVIGGGGAV
jgi:hypothetical protein